MEAMIMTIDDLNQRLSRITESITNTVTRLAGALPEALREGLGPTPDPVPIIDQITGRLMYTSRLLSDLGDADIRLQEIVG